MAGLARALPRVRPIVVFRNTWKRFDFVCGAESRAGAVYRGVVFMVFRHGAFLDEIVVARSFRILGRSGNLIWIRSRGARAFRGPAGPLKSSRSPLVQHLLCPRDAAFPFRVPELKADRERRLRSEWERLHPATPRVTAADIRKARRWPSSACPRRYCGWWLSSGFHWDLDPAEGCRWRESDAAWRRGLRGTPCRRCDPASTQDFYEPVEPYLREDGFRADRFQCP